MWSDEIVWVKLGWEVKAGSENLEPLAKGSDRAGLQNGARLAWDERVDAVLTSCQVRGISVLTVSIVESLVCVGHQKTLKIKVLKC